MDGRKQPLHRCEIQRVDPNDKTKMYSPFQVKTVDYTKILNDSEMISKLQNEDAVAREAHYHNV